MIVTILKSIIVLLFIFSIICCNNYDETIIEKEISTVLKNQEKAWNNGNIAEYMNGYWNNDSLKFIGIKKINYGWKKTLDGYMKNYPDKSYMGNLKFEIKSIDIISEDAAFVVGKWAIKRDKDDVDGMFSLLFRKINNNWVIVCDHTP